MLVKLKNKYITNYLRNRADRAFELCTYIPCIENILRSAIVLSEFIVFVEFKIQVINF